jgi:hypothetical protein
MTEPLKCDKCGNTSLTLLSSNIQGLNKFIDIYFCRKCQAGKTVITMKQDTFNDYRDPNIGGYSDIDIDVEDSYEAEEPENPYEDDDGGWDPSIG